MKAISLWQPWASLVAVGAKTIETRHWQPPAWLDGQRIAIHAAKRTAELWLVTGGPEAFRWHLGPNPLPLGAIVCTALLVHVEPITWALADTLEPDELAFGNYQPGRFAWHLADVHPLAEPVPTIGRQGIFDVPAPEPSA